MSMFSLDRPIFVEVYKCKNVDK